MKYFSICSGDSFATRLFPCLSLSKLTHVSPNLMYSPAAGSSSGTGTLSSNSCAISFSRVSTNPLTARISWFLIGTGSDGFVTVTVTGLITSILISIGISSVVFTSKSGCSGVIIPESVFCCRATSSCSIGYSSTKSAPHGLHLPTLPASNSRFISCSSKDLLKICTSSIVPSK